MERTPRVIYPGTFDPLTNGHVSLVRRGESVFGNVIVAVAEEVGKKGPLFSVEERVEMARRVFANDVGVTVERFSGLLVDYVAARNCNIIMRGLRAVSDFEYEFQMALMNRRLHRDIQTVFLITDYKWMYLSSTIVKEAARLGGDVRGLVPDEICEQLYERLGSAPDPCVAVPHSAREE